MASLGTTDAIASGAIRPSQRQKVLLCAFIAFACTAFLVAIAMFVSRGIAEWLLPHYGWQIVGFFYFGTLKYAVPPLFERNPVPVQVCFRGISSTLRILALYGAVTAALGWGSEDFGNPYLMVSAVQPVWTVAVPLAWSEVFRLAARAASRPRQPARCFCA